MRLSLPWDPIFSFGREIDSTEFRGVVALTAFPLLPRGQDWTAGTGNNPRHAHRVFRQRFDGRRIPGYPIRDSPIP